MRIASVTGPPAPPPWARQPGGEVAPEYGRASAGQAAGEVVHVAGGVPLPLHTPRSARRWHASPFARVCHVLPPSPENPKLHGSACTRQEIWSSAASNWQ